MAVHSQTPPEAELAFVGVDVIPMHGVPSEVLRDQTVLVQAGRIAAIGPAAEIPLPATARRIDGRARFLLPGIAEMHAHVWTPSEDLPARWIEDFMALFVLNGATTVRSMAGTRYQLELRRRIEAGELLGPTLLTASPGYTEASVRDPTQAARQVREHAAEGYDFIKIFEVDQDELAAIARAASDVGIRFGGHVPSTVGIESAIEAGYASIEHLDGYAAAQGWLGCGIRRLAERSARAGVWNAPTLDLWKTFLGTRETEDLMRRPELTYMPRAIVERWRLDAEEQRARAGAWLGRWRVSQRDAILRELHEAGARLLLASDAPQLFSVPGFSLAHEMQAMVEAGLPPHAVLEAATRNPAAYLGTPEAFGRVAVGARADLLLLRGNPLEDVSHVSRPEGVMVRGRWLGREEIESRLQAIAARMRNDE
jgi:imidazolonepropionase-like amidohydrolase